MTQRETPSMPQLRRAIWATWAGLWAERLTQAFWPLWAVLCVSLAMPMLDIHSTAPVELVWGSAVLAVLALLAALWWGWRSFRVPRRADVVARLDMQMPNRPLQALADTQATGQTDPAAQALWQAHQRRMAQMASRARAVGPDLRVSKKDPFALRYVALLALLVAVLFGSVWRLGTVGHALPGGGGDVANAASWEGWIEPPAYTGLPTLYLADQTADRLEVPQNSTVILRFYGQVGALALAETVSGRIGDLPPASAAEHRFSVAQPGALAISGDGGRSWQVALRSDQPPQISTEGQVETSVDGQMRLPFQASDDYGITQGVAQITLDLAAVPRHHGLAIAPEPRPTIEVALPMPLTGKRDSFNETLIEDFSQHPWAHLPVLITLSVQDAANQQAQAQPLAIALPARRFFDPVAAALIEQRRDLLWSRENGPRVAQLLRTLSHRPGEKLLDSETDYLRLRTIIRQLERNLDVGLGTDQQDELAAALWELALKIEEGDLDSALERMRQAQDKLQQAMKNGASDQEIARLMQELRDATQDYLRQMARQAERQNEQARENGEFDSEDAITMSQDDLQKMMDRIQELMQQGRMAEAQQALEELQRMLENMQVQQGQGQGQQSPGEQAMEGLADTLRQQQGLSDQAFRDLQEQFNPGNTPQGQNQGQQQGQQQGNGQQGQEGQNPGQQQGQDLGQSLADRQRALRQELDRQLGRLPNMSGQAGDDAREALDRAGRAMDQAENALRQDDLPGAIDRQSDAMEALREGIRNMGEAMARERQQQPGGENQQAGDAMGSQRDPLGRDPGRQGERLDTGDEMLKGEDVYRRARDLLDEIRRRTGEAQRSDTERDYLQRLLEKF